MFNFSYERFLCRKPNNIYGRNGILKTPHGDILTPAFIFCATKAAIKGTTINTIDPNTQIILSNTFHLQDYADIIYDFGGIHKFMNWSKPMLSDSGGFQIFSLGQGSVAEEIKGIKRSGINRVKITEDGCFFISPINGDKKFLSPEISIEIQKKIGVDLVVSFDECTASHAGYQYTKKSMERSHRWELRSLKRFNELNVDGTQALYGIVQGGVYLDLRDISTDFVNNNDFFGVCIGGSLGKTKEEMYNIVKYTSAKIDPKYPIHLLGIGKIEDILELAPYVDTFDCVEPTRIARHGMALTHGKRINLRKSIHKMTNTPIDPLCSCTTCQNYSIGYLHYLFRVQEISAIQALVVHNMAIMNALMEDIRFYMKNNNYEEIYNIWKV